MKRDKAAVSGTDANSVLKKHLSAAQRKMRKRIITAVAVSVIVVVVIAVVVISLRDSVSESYASGASGVETASVTVGSISTTISGSGTLADDDVEDVEAPASVDIDTVYVEEGDVVAEGDLIATVDTASVISAMAAVQEQIETIDGELDDVSGETVSSTIKAGLAGRVKKIYGEAGDDVATVMYENGALMLISLDGLMAADIETDAGVAAGDAVTVTLSDGTALDGTVQRVNGGVVTVTVTDNGTEFGDAVTVTDGSGNTLGTGTLYIHSELKVTGYAGTISKVSVAENSKVSASTKVFRLTDTSYTANYDTLLSERASLEDDLDKLIKLYKEGAVYSPISGVIRQTVRNLSGGNQQKVSLSKGLAVEPDILIIDEPTVGIDIKTKSEIHRIMYEITEKGKSVICITSDMPEIVQVADRIVVFKDGAIVGDLVNTKDYDEMSKKIMSLIMMQVKV